jgi:enoyl-CoA hydratase/carnithine racemase
MTDERVTISTDGGVADVRLNRPEKINALDDAQFAAIVDAGESLKKDPAIRAVVLSGNGGGFCAGLDFGRDCRRASLTWRGASPTSRSRRAGCGRSSRCP